MKKRTLMILGILTLIIMFTISISYFSLTFRIKQFKEINGVQILTSYDVKNGLFDKELLILADNNEPSRYSKLKVIKAKYRGIWLVEVTSVINLSDVEIDESIFEEASQDLATFYPELYLGEVEQVVLMQHEDEKPPFISLRLGSYSLSSNNNIWLFDIYENSLYFNSEKVNVNQLLDTESDKTNLVFGGFGPDNALLGLNDESVVKWYLLDLATLNYYYLDNIPTGHTFITPYAGHIVTLVTSDYGDEYKYIGKVSVINATSNKYSEYSVPKDFLAPVLESNSISFKRLVGNSGIETVLTLDNI